MDLCPDPDAHNVMPFPSRHHRAFTLVEVLVSLAIFALAAVALSAAYLNVLNGYRSSESERDKRANWALVRMQVLTEPDRSEIESGGRITLPDATTLQWSVQIEPTELADLFAVELTGEVFGDDTGTQRERLMLFRPNWSEPTDREHLRENNRQRFSRTRTP